MTKQRQSHPNQQTPPETLKQRQLQCDRPVQNQIGERAFSQTGCSWTQAAGDTVSTRLSKEPRALLGKIEQTNCPLDLNQKQQTSEMKTS